MLIRKKKRNTHNRQIILRLQGYKLSILQTGFSIVG